MKILFLGDIVGPSGCMVVKKHLKKIVEKKKLELTNLTKKFKELKSLVYGYKDEKEDKATKLNNDINNLQKELDKINNNYDQLISNTAKEIEEFVERVNLKN